MPHQFEKHYTRDEARALLPDVRRWLDRIRHLRTDLEKHDRRLSGLTGTGADVGGESVNQMMRTIADFKELTDEFTRRSIQIKDLDRGLIDFPAFVGGREVFLCWEEDEDDIEFWHDIDSGYAGRERL